MHKKTVAILYIVGLILWIGGDLLLNKYTQPNTGLTVGETVISLIGAALFLVSWIGALVNSARTGRWGWFFCLFFLSVFALIAYIFAGPVPSRDMGSRSLPST